MRITKLKIGKVQVENNLFLAPMAGFTDFAFRQICANYGAGLTFTELVSAKSITYENATAKFLLHTEEQTPCVAQIFGNEPLVMRRAIESESLAKFDIVDINMGCPAPKIFKNGEGSALLKDLALAEKIIKECAKTNKEITVKTRIGITYEKYTTRDFAVMAEQAGAKMISIHGRTREQFYSGEVNFEQIALAKSAVKIPVIANGGIVDQETADEIMEKTSADGVMIGRGALAKPYLFSELQNKEYSYSVKDTIFLHLDTLLKIYDDRTVAVNFRKLYPYYFKGMNGVKELRRKLNFATSVAEIKNLINESEIP